MASILVVDDEPDLRVMVRFILEDAGHSVLDAADGASALAAVQAEIPDLILLDLAMPGMDGWHVLDELRRQGLRERTRVIILSAYASPEVRARTKAAGVAAHIGKPFEPDALVHAVEEALAQSPEHLMRRQDRSGELAIVMSLLEGPEEETR